MHVERVPFLSTTTFYREYLDVRPVVITGMTRNWPASTTFTQERLRDADLFTLSSSAARHLIYIPRGWWHGVRGHDLCISVSAFSSNV